MLVMLLYVGFTIYKDMGIPYSISETYYRRKHKWVFQAVMLYVSSIMLPVMLECTKEDIQFTAFLTCIGMMMVGVSPNFTDKFEGKVHAVGAVLTLLFSQIWVGFHYPVLLSVWALYGLYLLYKGMYGKDNFIRNIYKTKPMFWIEITALVLTYWVVLFLVL